MGGVVGGWLSQTRPIPRSPDGDNNNTLTNTAHSREPFRYESLRTLCCWEGPESHNRLHHVQSGALGPTWSCGGILVNMVMLQNW